MVTFRLIEEDEQKIIYWYFPEGKEDIMWIIFLQREAQ